ncbi:MAG: efflux RND transporter periplasmic adaptor subunit [Acidobacteria bacterium]|nr:MAG: efflux RND transporter periplasmic adaptor subunit [Acidobacteriota bacterium]PYQ80141.1 MAG: efflux RND transporter periplasmic adaptor subunit [Acidobacteriota bacterium]PYQ89190.1 MAG: efflux RND transporter periplasmic adaptor subunit [Acidobacteriota bacterium]PYR12987.1 MAG: efflux RND transporter periplasmic adaptor subunit [Acidobacteriota bacterium]
MVLMRIVPRWILGGVVGAAAIALSGCSPGEAQSSNAPPAGGGRGGGQNAAVPVTVGKAIQKSMPITIQGIGTVIAASTVSVRAQITGEMMSVNFKEGEDVEQGQVLVTLDKRPFEAALQQAQATLEKDTAQAANARAQAARYQDLLQRGIATREQVDTMRTQATALEATVAADRANIETATVQLTYATIKSPMSGRTGLLQVHPGNLIRAQDTNPIVTINKITPVYVSFSVPEAQLPALKRYMGAQGTLPATALPPTEIGTPSAGRINFIDNAVDPTTGTIKVKGTFPNEDRRLWPGQFVNVTVRLTSDPKALVVPSAAVQTGQQGTFVFVVKPDQTVELRMVAVARIAGDETVLASGVSPGDTVVTDGHLRLVPGSRISVKNSNAPRATS